DGDRMERGVAAATRAPRLAVRVLVDARDGGPALAAVVTAEEAGGLGAGVEDTGLRGVPGGQVPDAAELAGERGARVVLLESESRAAGVPGLAEVIAVADEGAPCPVGAGGEESRRVAPVVHGHVVDGPAGEDRVRDGPPLPCFVGRVDEGALLGAYEHVDVLSCHGLLLCGLLVRIAGSGARPGHAPLIAAGLDARPSVDDALCFLPGGERVTEDTSAGLADAEGARSCVLAGDGFDPAVALE